MRGDEVPLPDADDPLTAFFGIFGAGSLPSATCLFSGLLCVRLRRLWERRGGLRRTAALVLLLLLEAAGDKYPSWFGFPADLVVNEDSCPVLSSSAEASGEGGKGAVFGGTELVEDPPRDTFELLMLLMVRRGSSSGAMGRLEPQKQEEEEDERSEAKQ